MMITFRFLVLSSLGAILVGCAGPTCSLGTASHTDHACWYKIKVTDLYPETDEVKGVNQGDPEYQTQPRTFRVENVKMKAKTGQLEAGETYTFINVDHSTYLQVLPKDY
jgi:hypothetical protein